MIILFPGRDSLKIVGAFRIEHIIIKLACFEQYLIFVVAVGWTEERFLLQALYLNSCGYFFFFPGYVGLG